MDYKEAYGQSLRLLNIRFLSEGELRKKLRDREAAEEVIDEVMEQLKEEHFIDDQRLAAAVYRSFARKGQYGHLYICNRLKRRFLPVPEDVERVDEDSLARKLMAKKFPDRGADPAKIARFLQYRGFSLGIIQEIVNSRE
jgi:regulatory protein